MKRNLIKLPPRVRRAALSEPNEAGLADLIEVDFSGRSRLESALDHMDNGWRDNGLGDDVTTIWITSDGVALLLRGDASGRPEVVHRFNADKLRDYITERLVRGKRIREAIGMIDCPHPDDKRTRGRRYTTCEDCGKHWYREPKYRLCRKLPKAPVDRCRRRESHDGPCSWDPEWHWKKQL